MYAFHDPRETTNFVRAGVLPQQRIAPSDAAERYLRNEKGAWQRDNSPMMSEPLDLLASRRYNGIVYVGPARTGKTFSFIHGGMAYCVCCAPGDMLITQMSQDAARDFSRNEVDRVIRYSPEISIRMSGRKRDDNTFDKFFKAGHSVKIGWPAISQLSSKTLKYVFLTDYDRPENRDNVDGEGPIWDLAYKRIATYMSRGKCVAESSPGEELTNLSWRPSTPNEAPPVPGILSLYNRGTRARWYWPCMHCGEFFETKPGLSNFALPPFEELEEFVVRVDLLSAATGFAHVACPHCGGLHDMEHRRDLNVRGRWVHEGEAIDGAGRITGERRGTLIASYWQSGVSATYQRWDHMILQYLQAVHTYTRTGDETDLKATTIQDQAAVYVPRAAVKRRSPEELMARREDWEKGTVPEGVRFITAQIDVQLHRFVVQVTGWGHALESWILDRYNISSSKRTEGDRTAAIAPASYVEDWHLLIDEVIKKRYPLAADARIQIPIRLTVCDSGGADGVTSNAYDFWRKCRALSLATRFLLVKGDHRPSTPRAAVSYPDTRNRKSRHAGAAGDVPVWLLNSNILKDAIAGDLARLVPGPGYVHFPKWLDEQFFRELTAETRGDDGWERKAGVHNESFDLHYYGRAACIILGAEKIDWSREPQWITDQFLIERPKIQSLTDLARSLNG